MALAFERVSDLGEAVAVLGELGASGRPLAGGTDLMPDVRSGRVTDATLVDISRVEELRALEVSEDVARIGCLVTAAELARSPRIAASLPVLASAAGSLGSPQIRARATVGGNVANASPAADLAVALVAAGAEVETAGVAGVRSYAVDDFAFGPGATRLGPGELVTGFTVPVRVDARYGYTKVGLRRALACAVVNVGLKAIPADARGTFREVRLAVGAVAPAWVRAREAEELLTDRTIDEDTVERAAAAAVLACAPIDDVRASAAYRRHLIGVQVARLLRTLVEHERSAGGR